MRLRPLLPRLLRFHNTPAIKGDDELTSLVCHKLQLRDHLAVLQLCCCSSGQLTVIVAVKAEMAACRGGQTLQLPLACIWAQSCRGQRLLCIMPASWTATRRRCKLWL